MEYYHILYSRSKTIDYRWIFVPPNIPSTSLNLLNEIYDNYDTIKGKLESIDAGTHPTFFIQSQTLSLLVQCLKTEFKDKFGRTIYAMQGVAVSPFYLREFWYALPSLLIEQHNMLNPWRNYEFSELDRYSMHVGESRSIDVYDVVKKSKKSLRNLGHTSHRDTYRQIKLEYSIKGFEALLKLLLSPQTSVVQFAYGIVPTDLAYFREFPIVAIIKSSPSNQTNNENRAGNKFTAAKYPSEPLYQYPRLETCEITVMPKLGKNKFGMKPKNTLHLVVKVTSGFYRKELYSKDLGTPASQFDLFSESPTLTGEKELKKIIQQLAEDGWEEVTNEQDYWWDYKFKRNKR